MNTNDQILEDSIFRIGRVISVDGRIVKIKVDKAKNPSHLVYKGELLRNIAVGGYVKIAKGFTRIVGKVDGEFISEEKDFGKKEYRTDAEKISRILNISLLGFFKDSQFERGIKELPLIDNECFLLQSEEFNQVHDFLRKDDEPITIGALSLEKGQAISVGVNSLFASHIGVFGNTGSGKSYTVAKLYHELLKNYKDNPKFQSSASFFLLDFNGEYVSDDDNVIVEKSYKNVFKLSTRTLEGGDKFPITKDTLFDPSFWTVLCEATEKTQAPFLRRALRSSILPDDSTGDPNAPVHNAIISIVEEVITKKDKLLGRKVFVELFAELRPSILAGC